MKPTPLLRTGLLCSIAAMAPIAAHAQIASTTNTSTTARSGTLQEVIVTAARRAQNLQKTSIAVTAISGTTIQKQGLTNMNEIISIVPGVTVTGQQRGFTPTIRGQGTDLPPGSGQGAVAVEEDGIYNIRAESGVIGYYDLARVEVLPGPQGTLYGVNSDGGVVNVISNDPVLGKYTGSVSLNVGNYALYRGEGAVNVPLGQTLALRVAGAAINRGPYVTPKQADAVAQSVRVKLLYQPTDYLSALAGYEYDHIGGLGTGEAIHYYKNGDINNYSNPWAQGIGVTSGPGPSNDHEHETDWKAWADVTYKLDNIATISILPAYNRDRDADQQCGASGPPGTVGPGSCDTSPTAAELAQGQTEGTNGDPRLLEQVSSEERINSVAGSAIEWDVGAYHWNYRELGTGGGPGGSYYGEQSNAGFGEITYPLMNDTLRLIGGIRMGYDHKTNLEESATPKYTIAANFSHLDYLAKVEYDLTPVEMEYFSVATGYRPGGFNQSQSTTGNGAPSVYPNEQVTSFELGSKNRFLDNTLQVNADAFYYLQHDYQLLDFYMPDVPACQAPPGVPTPSYCSPPTLSLQAHVFGIELQSRYDLTADDEFSFNAAYLDAKFNNNQTGGCVSVAAGAPATGCYAAGNNPINNVVFYENISGLTQPHAPTMSGNASYTHTIELANGATLSGQVQINASSGYYTHPIESPYSYQPAYWQQGLSTSYTAADGTWSVNAYVRNLSNYAVKNSLNPQVISEPRTYGATGTWHF